MPIDKEDQEALDLIALQEIQGQNLLAAFEHLAKTRAKLPYTDLPEADLDNLVDAYMRFRLATYNPQQAGPVVSWESREAGQFRKGLQKGYHNILFCYAAASIATGQPNKKLKFGPDLYDDRVITTENYANGQSDPWVFDHFRDAICAALDDHVVADWGTSLGKRLIHMLLGTHPRMVIPIESVPVNLERTKAELLLRGHFTHGLQEEFYDNPALIQNGIWRFLRDMELPQVHTQIGGTPFNKNAKIRIGLWREIADKLTNYKPKTGAHKLVVSANLKQHQPDDRKGYETDGFFQFYLGGLYYGYKQTGIYIEEMDRLRLEVVQTKEGWQTQLNSPIPLRVMFKLEGVPMDPIFLFPLKLPLKCTRLDRPSYEKLVGQARKGGGWKVVPSESGMPEPTWPFRPPGMPADKPAELGIFVFTHP